MLSLRSSSSSSSSSPSFHSDPPLHLCHRDDYHHQRIRTAPANGGAYQQTQPSTTSHFPAVLEASAPPTNKACETCILPPLQFREDTIPLGPKLAVLEPSHLNTTAMNINFGLMDEENNANQLPSLQHPPSSLHSARNMQYQNSMRPTFNFNPGNTARATPMAPTFYPYSYATSTSQQPGASGTIQVNRSAPYYMPSARAMTNQLYPTQQPNGNVNMVNFFPDMYTPPRPYNDGSFRSHGHGAPIQLATVHHQQSQWTNDLGAGHQGYQPPPQDAYFSQEQEVVNDPSDSPDSFFQDALDEVCNSSVDLFDTPDTEPGDAMTVTTTKHSAEPCRKAAKTNRAGRRTQASGNAPSSRNEHGLLFEGFADAEALAYDRSKPTLLVDDWVEVKENPVPFVKMLVGAFQQQYAPAPENQILQDNRRWLQYQEDHAGRVAKYNESEIEASCWILLKNVVECHEYGMKRQRYHRIETAITCINHLNLIIRAIRNYTVIRYDVVRLQRHDELVCCTTSAVNRKIANFKGNYGKANRDVKNKENALSAGIDYVPVLGVDKRKKAPDDDEYKPSNAPRSRKRRQLVTDPADADSAQQPTAPKRRRRRPAKTTVEGAEESDCATSQRNDPSSTRQVVVAGPDLI